MEVSVNGSIVHVTGKEYRLLLELTKRIGVTVPRERECRVSELEPGLNFKNLDNFVAKLRNRLGDARNLIETVRGEGHRLIRPAWSGFLDK